MPRGERSEGAGCLQVTAAASALRRAVDVRLAAMLVALVVIWIALQVATDGLFLSSRNLYNLSLQGSAVAIMTCGMVFVIVARQIDLSVGSLLAFTGVLTAYIQVGWADAHPDAGWIMSIGVGLGTGALVGLFQGWLVAYQGIPAFVVTLAGFLMYRGAAFRVAEGQTIAPLDDRYQRLGGGADGSLGVTWSWVLGAVACVWVLFYVWNTRRERAKYNSEASPRWLDVAKIVIGCAAIVAFVAVMVSYPNRAKMDDAGNAPGMGIGIPVLILIVVAVVLTFLSHRTRFGRYVFAYGGNPEAAVLAGVNTRRLLVLIFVLMGLLSALAGIVTTARLNAGTNSLGLLAELYVIAAAVIGGTSLSGGIGSVPGAILGAFIIQSLLNGMVLLDVASANQQIFIGLILIVAVKMDVAYTRRRTT
ncbi:MAG TPA: sugar ABC transporter permease [Kofleriaceae bacterium]|nr:sugar ABC transporter permease [Kofleriaceae bacterium]